MTKIPGMRECSPDRTQLSHRIPNDLLARVDKYRAGTGLSRNAAINLLTSLALDAAEAAR